MLLSGICRGDRYGAVAPSAWRRPSKSPAAWFAQRHHHHQRQTTSAARPEIRRRDQGESLGVETVVGAARRAAEGRAQRAAHHDGRLRLRRAEHVRRRHSDPGAGSHREERAALHEFPLHVALLADARGVDHRPQPSRRRLWRGGRNRDGVPGLRLGHPERERHHRYNPEGERLRDLVVRQGPQHALLSGDPGRAVRPVAERHGLRVLLRLRRRRHQPVATEPVPQHDGHLSLPGQPGLEPDHGHGRRGDPVHEASSRRSRPASRASSITCRAAPTAPHHPTQEWIKKISDMHLFDGGWNKLRETIFANQKRLGIMPANAELTPGRRQAIRRREAAGVGFPQLGGEEALHQAGGCLWAPTSPTPTTRSAASSRPSKTWASSTTP